MSRNETYLNIGSKTFVCSKFDSLKFDFHLEPFKAFVRERKSLLTAAQTLTNDSHFPSTLSSTIIYGRRLRGREIAAFEMASIKQTSDFIWPVEMIDVLLLFDNSISLPIFSDEKSLCGSRPCCCCRYHLSSLPHEIGDGSTTRSP